jgi:integrase
LNLLGGRAAKVKLTAKELKAIGPGATLWDTEVRGLGARVQRRDVVFVFKAVSPVTKKQIYITIGRHGRGDWTLDDARRRAAEYRDAIGRDPAADRDARRAMPSVAALCDEYLAAVPTLLLRRSGRAKRESTLKSDRGRIERHIKPLLGHLSVDRITRSDVEAAMHRIAQGATAAAKGGTGPGAGGRGARARGGKGVAARTVGLLGGIFAFAISRGLRADSPVRGVVRYADNVRDRRLSDEEYGRLGAALLAAETPAGPGGRPRLNPAGVAAVRLLAITGWRSGEVTGLRWDELDLARRTALLRDTKTGRSPRPLSRAAVELIRAQPRTTSPCVFPGAVAGKGLQSLGRIFAELCRLGGLPGGLTPNVLRHSFNSLANDLNYTEATRAALVGHKLGGVNSSVYTHMADPVLLAAADRVAEETLGRMGLAAAGPGGIRAAAAA